MKAKHTLALAAVFAAASAFSEDSAPASLSQADVDEQNRLSDPSAVVSAADLVEDWKIEALRQLKVDEGVTPDGKYVVFAAANVALPNTDPQFGDALASAFDVAMLEAQQRMLMDRFGRIVTEKTRETFRDNSTNAKEIPLDAPASAGGAGGVADKALRVLDKTLSLSEAKLDKALDEYGVPHSEYQTAPVEKKKTLLKNAMLKETLKTASGEIAGVFPVQTTVKMDKKGNAKIGVILIMSPKSVQVAKDISLQRKSLIAGKGADLHSKFIPKTPEQWCGQLGTRLAYDQDGRPAIVSYGMGAYVPDGDDDYINDELKEEARKQAMDNADAQIAEVVAGRMSAQSSRLQGESVEKTVTRAMTLDSPTFEKTAKEVIKQSQSFAKSQAKMEMKGLTTLGSKFVKLPSGQQMCYVIRAWTYTGLEAVESLDRAMAAPDGVDPVKKSGVAGDLDGFLVNDVDDF
ncbi:MAG: hypothetical protein IJ783_00010 [Kiritimatiellae bacterium]|nr:hypothetical protein [Kiritimatiellia bacterium]